MSMSIVWILMIVTRVSMVISAPKLGPVLFDPLSFEASNFKQIQTEPHDVYSTSSALKETTNTPTINIDTTAQPEKTTFTTFNFTNSTGKSANKTENVEEVPNKLSDVFKLIENALKMPKNLLKSLRTDDRETQEPCAEYEYNGKICKIINNRLLCGYNKNKGDLKNDEFVDIGNGCRIHKERIECGYAIGPFNNPRRPPARDEYRNDDESIKPLRNVVKLKLRGAFVTHQSSTSEPKTASLPAIQTSLNPKIIRIQVTTNSTPEQVISTIQETTDSTIEQSTVEQSTVEQRKSTQELVTSPPPTDIAPEITTNQKTSTSLDVSDFLEQEILTNTSSHSAKIARSIVSVANEKPNPVDTSADATASKILPKRVCVEKGDRIVCYYTKNY